MTESDWLNSTEPQAMLRWLINPAGPANPKIVPSDRQLRLFAVACCWSVGTELGKDAEQCMEWESGPAKDAINWARAWSGDQKKPTQTERAALLRDVCGNPWRPLPQTQVFGGLMKIGWLTPTIRALAEAAYTERLGKVCERCRGEKRIAETRQTWAGWRECPNCRGTGRIEDGSLDPIRLAILADALEDSGCDNADILMHLRGMERCPKCEAGKIIRNNGDWFACRECNGVGWISRRSPCVRGCHVLELLQGSTALPTRGEA